VDYTLDTVAAMVLMVMAIIRSTVRTLEVGAGVEVAVPAAPRIATKWYLRSVGYRVFRGLSKISVLQSISLYNGFMKDTADLSHYD